MARLKWSLWIELVGGRESRPHATREAKNKNKKKKKIFFGLSREILNKMPLFKQAFGTVFIRVYWFENGFRTHGTRKKRFPEIRNIV